MAHLEVNHANFGRNFVLILKGLQSILITGGLTKFSTSTGFGAKRQGTGIREQGLGRQKQIPCGNDRQEKQEQEQKQIPWGNDS